VRYHDRCRARRGAKLDLRGFTLSSGTAAVACVPVQCDVDWCGPTKSGRCEVFNGTITGAYYDAVVGGKIVLRDLTIVDNRVYAALAFSQVRATNVHVIDTPNGVQANHEVIIRSSTFDGAEVNSGGRAQVEASTITNDPIVGVGAPRIYVKGSTVTGNGVDRDVRGSRPHVRRSHVGCAAEARCDGDVRAQLPPRRR